MLFYLACLNILVDDSWLKDEISFKKVPFGMDTGLPIDKFTPLRNDTVADLALTSYPHYHTCQTLKCESDLKELTFQNELRQASERRQAKHEAIRKGVILPSSTVKYEERRIYVHQYGTKHRPIVSTSERADVTGRLTDQASLLRTPRLRRRPPEPILVLVLISSLAGYSATVQGNCLAIVIMTKVTLRSSRECPLQMMRLGLDEDPQESTHTSKMRPESLNRHAVPPVEAL
ncbi:hypothetical protein BGZ63DRAFT_404017 [Mariannaea sp. PMI_226]|nr:hypothetical protein BGZ63DRAFT_404017 [Mariannaea sp. PMI_226]